MVERWSEEPEVSGSTPEKGTLKHSNLSIGIIMAALDPTLQGSQYTERTENARVGKVNTTTGQSVATENSENKRIGKVANGGH